MFNKYSNQITFKETITDFCNYIKYLLGIKTLHFWDLMLLHHSMDCCISSYMTQESSLMRYSLQTWKETDINNGIIKAFKFNIPFSLIGFLFIVDG